MKIETSALLLSEFLQVVKSYLKFRLRRKYSITDPEVLDLSYTSTASWLLYVHSAPWDKLYILNLGLEKEISILEVWKKVFDFATKNLCEPCYDVILCSQVRLDLKITIYLTSRSELLK